MRAERVDGRRGWRRLAEIASGFSGTKVAVLGDMVLDRFWYGAVQRVSREAPVPIVRLERSRLLPGCAANTVLNLAALGATVHPLGVVGDDEAGRDLRRLLEEAGIDGKGLVTERGWETPTKTRILAGTPHGPRQQLVRVDAGETNALTGPVRETLGRALSETARCVRALVLSDYGYGLVPALWENRPPHLPPVTALDSRFNLSGFTGLTTATPNEEEFEQAVGRSVGDDEDLLCEAGRALRARQNLKALLVTRGAKGMALFQEGEAPVFLPIVGSDQVVDVTGAGDTVMAAYVLALAGGASFLEAALLADVAGGIVVQKHGTATTSVPELLRTLREWGEGRL